MSNPIHRKRRPNGSPLSKAFILENVSIDPSTGCWNWIRGTSKGYGRAWNLTGYDQAHCAAYKLWKGPIPKGMFGCHRCDNRICCNPDHVFVGTQFDNMRDASSKGRVVIPNRKLSNIQVSEIRADQRPGTVIAKDYGLSASAVCLIKKFKTYKEAH